mgnify:FL=1
MIDTIESLKTRRNGAGARPNVRVRQTARETTDAYYAEVVRQAAGVDEPVPLPIKRRVLKVAAVILLAVALCVGLWLS